MSVSKNRLLYFILIACILLSSCKQIIKKATTNTAKKAEIEVYEKMLENQNLEEKQKKETKSEKTGYSI